MLRAFAEALPAQSCPTLRDVICSGEALPRAVRDLFAARHGARLHNGAETDRSGHRCQLLGVPEESGAGRIPIGHPSSIRAYASADDSMNLSAPGTAGGSCTWAASRLRAGASRPAGA